MQRKLQEMQFSLALLVNPYEKIRVDFVAHDDMYNNQIYILYLEINE